MDRLGDTITAALKKLPGNTGTEARVVLLWPEIVGPDLAKRSEVTAIQGGTLLISVSGPAWAQELSYQKPQILARYRKLVGRDVVRDFRTKDAQALRRPSSASASPQAAAELRAVSLTPDDRRRIEARVRTSSPELADALRRAMTADVQRHRWQLEHGARPCPRCGAAYRQPYDLCPACRVDANPPERGA